MIKAGVRKVLTTSRSVKRESMDTTEIGLMCEGSRKEGILRIDWITADFHWDGTVKDERDKLIR